MHELSLAMSVIKIIEQEASKSNLSKVNSIEIEVGNLSGVEIQAFEFSMNSVMKSSHYKNARIVLIPIKAISICSECNQQFSPISRYESCPKCHSVLTTLLQGSEFRLTSITFSSD